MGKSRKYGKQPIFIDPYAYPLLMSTMYPQYITFNLSTASSLGSSPSSPTASSLGSSPSSPSTHQPKPSTASPSTASPSAPSTAPPTAPAPAPSSAPQPKPSSAPPIAPAPAPSSAPPSAPQPKPSSAPPSALSSAPTVPPTASTQKIPITNNIKTIGSNLFNLTEKNTFQFNDDKNIILEFANIIRGDIVTISNLESIITKIINIKTKRKLINQVEILQIILNHMRIGILKYDIIKQQINDRKIEEATYNINQMDITKELKDLHGGGPKLENEIINNTIKKIRNEFITMLIKSLITALQEKNILTKQAAEEAQRKAAAEEAQRKAAAEEAQRKAAAEEAQRKAAAEEAQRKAAQQAAERVAAQQAAERAAAQQAAQQAAERAAAQQAAERAAAQQAAQRAAAQQAAQQAAQRAAAERAAAERAAAQQAVERAAAQQAAAQKAAAQKADERTAEAKKKCPSKDIDINNLDLTLNCIGIKPTNKIAFKLHPDKNLGCKLEAEEKLKELNVKCEAYYNKINRLDGGSKHYKLITK